MRTIGLAMLLAALAVAPATGQRSTRPTSVYTPLDLDRCTVLSRVEEGESVAWRCPGFAGVPLFVLSGDGRFDLDAGIDNEMWESPEQFSGLPARVEWRLRALGVGIALDDFGTGYSSLGYLNKAVFHKLKIDGSFVRDAAVNRETVAIIQSIVSLAKSFRMTVTAEGVETADDFTRMRDLGVHQIQGYLFGRPMTFERASELVHGSTRQRLSA